MISLFEATQKHIPVSSEDLGFFVRRPADPGFHDISAWAGRTSVKFELCDKPEPPKCHKYDCYRRCHCDSRCPT